MRRWICILALCLAACQTHRESGGRPEAALHLNMSSDPLTLDPRRGGDLASSYLQFMLFEGLFYLHSDGSLSHAAAQSHEVSEDGMTYTFHLREGYWSDGSALTAYDFVRTWKEILTPGFDAISAPLLYCIKHAEAAKKGLMPLEQVGITAADERTLVVTLQQPTPYFLDLLSFCAFAPVPSQLNEGHSVSNGPFVLKRWDHDRQIVLQKNPYYRQRERIQLDQIRISMIGDETSALKLFKRGELDIIGHPLSPLPSDAVESLKKEGVLQLAPSPGTALLTFNTKRSPFHNLHLRQAFAKAIDREAIVKNVTQLEEMVASGILPPALKMDPAKREADPCDAQQAKALLQQGLDELGLQLSDLSNLIYLYPPSHANQRVAQAIQDQWLRVLGVRVQLQALEHKLFLDRVMRRDYCIAQVKCIAQYHDPLSLLERFKTKDNPKNYSGWESEEFVCLLQRAAQAQGAMRRTLLEQAERVMMQEMPIAPLYHLQDAFLVSPRVRGEWGSAFRSIAFDTLSIADDRISSREICGVRADR